MMVHEEVLTTKSASPFLSVGFCHINRRAQASKVGMDAMKEKSEPTRLQWIPSLCSLSAIPSSICEETNVTP
jgi:hypothetical protein